MRDLELQQNWRRWRLRVGRGAENEQQLAGAGTCESICNFVLRSQVFIFTRDLQCHNEIGDAGACGLGQGLKMNNCLHTFVLVSDSEFCSWSL